MPVTFVIGRAGSGKTARCLDRIVEQTRAHPLGPPIWLLLPKQATYQAERELLARLGAFSRVRVVSVDRLGLEILAEVGGVATKQVTAAGRRMLIGRLLFQNHEQLRYFTSSARRPGLADAINQAFDDFERSGRPLDELPPGFGPVSAGLTAKLDDLRLIYGQYAALLQSDRLDPHRRRLQVLAQLTRSELVKGSTIYVDGFYDFTDHERKMIAGASQVAAEVEINLTLDPDSPVLVGEPARVISPFFRSEVAFLKLFAAVREAGVATPPPIRLTEVHRFKSAALLRIERTLFPAGFETVATETTSNDAGSSQAEASGSSRVRSDTGVLPGLQLFEATDPRVEATAVARRIRDLLREGFRQRDIVVLTRNLENHLHLLHAAFAEHGLTYFADHRRSATHHPLVRLVRAALQIAREDWLAPAVLELARTRLAGLTTEESDELDNYLRDHGITADGWLGKGVWDYVERVDVLDEEFDVPAPPPPTKRTMQAIRLHLVDRLQPLAARLNPRAPKAPAADLARELVATLERFDIRKTLAGWIAADRSRAPDQAAEHEQVWTQLVAMLQEMVEIVGEQEMGGGEFCEIVESGLDDFELAIAPVTLDQVLIGSVDRTRVLLPRAVFVMGMSQGVFPPTHRDSSLLTGSERRELHRSQIDVEPDSQRKQLDERFLAYIGLTRASERLIVSRSLASENGRKYEPSEFWIALRRAVPEANVEPEAPCTSDNPHCLATPRDMVTSMLDWARTQIESQYRPATGATADESWRWELYHWISTAAPFPAAVERVVDQAWPSLCYSNPAALSPEHAKALFPLPLVATAPQLESFSTCPFQHFVSYGLRLKGRRSGDITPLDLSRVYHGALEQLVKRSIELRQRLTDIPPADLAVQIREAAQHAAAELRRETLLAEARSQYLLDRVGRTLEMVVGTITEQLSMGSFRPVRAGVPFGPEARLKSPELPLKGGGVLKLRGTIDRVDETSDGGLAAFDYRMGDQPISAGDVYDGLNLRLLTCLLVLEQSPTTQQAKKLFPVAALSARLLRSLQKVDHPSEAQAPESREYRLSAKPRGLVRESHLQAFDKNLSVGKTSDVLAAGYTKKGEIARADYSDAIEDDDFQLLMRFVDHKVREVAGKIVSGMITVSPYRRNEKSPCSNCDYRSICRFEKSINQYHYLDSLKRPQAMDRMREAIGEVEG